MSRFRIFLILGLVLALGGVSCTAGELPMETRVGGVPVDGEAVPTDSSGAAPTDTVTVPVDTTEATPVDPSSTSDVDLLACEPQRYAADMKVIGPAGGQLLVGNHKLTILPNALSKDVPIVMEQIEGTVNSVRFSPEGLQFAYPAILSLSYKNCPTSWHHKRIVYTDESLAILEVMPSLDFNKASQVKGLINHFSRYAIAF